MTELQEKFRLPDFEVRANIFAHRVRRTGTRINNAHPHHRLECEALSALPEWIAMMDNLHTMLPHVRLDGFPTPNEVANSFDQESAKTCLIGIHALSDEPTLLREFLKEIFLLADEQNGILDKEFLPLPLSTAGCEEYIHFLDGEAEGLAEVYLHFSFS